MKLSTAIRTLDNQAAWLGITGPELLEDIARHGKILYPDVVVEAYEVYTIYNELERSIPHE